MKQPVDFNGSANQRYVKTYHFYLAFKLQNNLVKYRFLRDGRFCVLVGISPTTQEVACSIPAQCKHLCA
jgi:hypothetical protein